MQCNVAKCFYAYSGAMMVNAFVFEEGLVHAVWCWLYHASIRSTAELLDPAKTLNLHYGTHLLIKPLQIADRLSPASMHPLPKLIHIVCVPIYLVFRWELKNQSCGSHTEYLRKIELLIRVGFPGWGLWTSVNRMQKL